MLQNREGPEEVRAVVGKGMDNPVHRTQELAKHLFIEHNKIADTWALRGGGWEDGELGDPQVLGWECQR